MKTEKSAGGIVVRKIKAAWEVLLVKDMKDRLTFPKGKVEQGESELSAARREVEEEVGIHDLAKPVRLPGITYWYHRNGLINKSVQYYLFFTKGREQLICQTEEGIHDAEWMPVDQAIDMVGYQKTNKPLLEQVLWILKKRRTSKN